jgi:hypothetical protein
MEVSCKFSAQILYFPIKVNQILAWQAHQHLMFLHLYCQLFLSLPILMCMNLQPRNLRGRMISHEFFKILGQPSFFGQNRYWGRIPTYCWWNTWYVQLLKERTSSYHRSWIICKNISVGKKKNVVSTIIVVGD